MLLGKYRGDHYKCIEDSGEILVHKKITRMVGQNEAGKTALLELLNILRPLGSTTAEFALEDYPRKKFNRYKQTHEENPHTPISAVFDLEEEEITAIENEFGKKVLNSPTVKLSKKYGASTLYFSIDVNEQAFLKHVLETKEELNEDVKAILKKTKTLQGFREELAKLNQEHQAVGKELPEDLSKEIYGKLSKPSFFYFDEYASLPGEISLKKLKEFVAAKKYTGDDWQSLQTAKALVDFAGAEIDEFLNRDNYERLKADLEAASNEITDQLRRFWTSNQNLEIRFDLESKLHNNQLIDTILHVRVYNTKHRVTVSFNKRSKGFVWFFSFLVAFSEYKDHDEKIILLLDEPGLNLGAIAQRDLMRYFEEELAPHHQIIYTTHSPFMIDPRQLDTVRTVEDEENNGTRVSNDPCRHKSETLFPLQAALGYDLSQTFFVAPNNLLVEGPADLIYFNLATQALEQEKRIGLTDSWTPVPVGGADKIASFVSLLGSQGLNLAVFMDVSNTDQQRFDSILRNKLLVRKNLLTVGSVLGRAEADVEDLFSVNSYLKLVSHSYRDELGGKSISPKDLTDQSPRIIKRLETYFTTNGIHQGKFSHYKPAYDLMMNPSLLSEVFDDETKNNFEKAFASLNKLLDEEAASAKNSLPVQQFKSRAKADGSTKEQVRH